MPCVIIKDNYGDVHADTVELPEDMKWDAPEATPLYRKEAEEFCARMAFDPDETIRFGRSKCDNPGLARLLTRDVPREWLGEFLISFTEDDVDRANILTSMARTLWVCAWADEIEERGETIKRGACNGADLMDLAPETPEQAHAIALDVASKLEKANGGVSLEALLMRAREADVEAGYEIESVGDYEDLFGHYMVMQALGSGVSWFDDHADCDIEVPYCGEYEVPLRDLVKPMDEE